MDFRPFTLTNYLESVTYIDGQYCVKARFQNKEISTCQLGYQNTELLREWKKNLAKAMASRSTTVVLETACGCTRMQDGIPNNQYTVVVPLTLRVPTPAETFSEFQLQQDARREFKWDKYRPYDSVTGCRLYKEVYNV